jgi:hypothetical protein
MQQHCPFANGCTLFSHDQQQLAAAQAFMLLSVLLGIEGRLQQ